MAVGLALPSRSSTVFESQVVAPGRDFSVAGDREATFELY